MKTWKIITILGIFSIIYIIGVFLWSFIGYTNWGGKDIGNVSVFWIELPLKTYFASAIVILFCIWGLFGSYMLYIRKKKK